MHAGNDGRADVGALTDGGQSLHVGTKQSREELGLGFAQLRELCRDMCHGAVVLAELVTVATGAGDDRRRIPFTGQRLCQRSGTLGNRHLRQHRLIPLANVLNPFAGELVDGQRATHLGEVAQRLGGQIVVGLVKSAPPELREGKDLGWPTTASTGVRPVRAALAALNLTFG